MHVHTFYVQYPKQCLLEERQGLLHESSKPNPLLQESSYIRGSLHVAETLSSLYSVHDSSKSTNLLYKPEQLFCILYLDVYLCFGSFLSERTCHFPLHFSVSQHPFESYCAGNPFPLCYL